MLDSYLNNNICFFPNTAPTPPTPTKKLCPPGYEGDDCETGTVFCLKFLSQNYIKKSGHF